MPILEAAPRKYVVKSRSKAFHSFLWNDPTGLGYAASDMVDAALVIMRSSMSAAMRTMHDLGRTPYKLVRAVEKDILCRPVGDKGGWYSIRYKRNSSISYLFRGRGDHILLHPNHND